MRRQRLRWRLLTALVVLMRGSHAALLKQRLLRLVVRAAQRGRAPQPELAARRDAYQASLR